MGGQIAVLVTEGDRTSPHVDRAIEKAADEEATLHAVYVIDAWRFGEYSVYGWEELAREIHTDKSEVILDEIRDRCQARGIDFESRVTEGDPQDVMESYVTANDIDWLVCRHPDGSGRPTQSPRLLDRLDADSSASLEVV
ncbi:universal stress protein [Halorhabdus sp. CBA1104]|uniref:universal stress protein n=1 Tax=Halorhabdus sp. CBA1104 TaxID=1380432 RepID=UPI0012B430D9|nr:universal stress protein [Halorhabdus sp. CBA1104]QGN07968.1 universal stress protein [Halorhabdus sp. CBA1104]